MQGPDVTSGNFTLLNLSDKPFVFFWDSQKWTLDPKDEVQFTGYLARHAYKHGKRAGIRMYTPESITCEDCGNVFENSADAIKCDKSHDFAKIQANLDEQESMIKKERQEQILNRLAARIGRS